MRTSLGALLVVVGFLTGGAPVRADECCERGAAVPWKGYNQGVHWALGLSKEPARWSALAEAGFRIEAGSSLAARTALLAAAGGARPDWKEGLQPALDRARAQGKLVMFFQLVGDLDFGGC